MGVSISLIIAAIITIILDFGKAGLVIAGIIFGFELILWAINIVITWRLAKNTAPDYQLREYNHWYIYLVFVLIAIVGTSVGAAFVIREHIIQAFVVPTSSMSPTIEPGDRILALKGVYFDRAPERGELVVCRNPEKLRMFYVKRLIATAGDMVEWREDGDVLVNGELLTHTPDAESGEFSEKNGGKSYSIRLTPPETVDEKSRSGRVIVPPHHGFVMGDNRFNSKDSRHFDPLPYANLQAKPVAKLWGSGELR